MAQLLNWFLAALAASTSTAFPSFPSAPILKIKEIPATVATGNSTANYVSSQYSLDGPQVSSISNSSWDWWYFDALSTDLKTSLVIVFYTALPSAFPFLLSSTNVTIIGLYATFANGTHFAVYLDADEAVVVTAGDGSSGVYNGAGAAWLGAPDMSSYQVIIDSPENGVVGTFNLESVAPAHYPCGPAGAGVNMTSGSGIGWSNAVPDAIGEVDFVLNGSSLAFTGIAYHDKNWSDEPFFDSVSSWYWGHGRLGKYSIVWFDFLGLDGTEYVSAYASMHGQIITASCRNGSANARPSDGDYPPKANSTNPSGFSVELDLGLDGILSVNVTVATILVEGKTLYTRWAGSMVGSFDGGKLIEGGIAVFEQFNLAALAQGGT